MRTPKVITTVDFTAKTLTVVKGVSLLTGEKLIFKIIDPSGTTIYINSGFNTTDFSSPDIVQGASSELEVDAPTDSNDAILQGTYTLYYLSSQTRLMGTMTINYCFTEPTVDVSLEYSCRSSSITSTDNTEYDVYCPCSGTDVTPNTTRTHTVKYPTTMKTPIADVVSTDATVTITPIWTKYWVSRVTSALIYKMPSACSTGDTTYRIVGTVTGIAEATVVCDSCLCFLYECVSSVITKWLSIKETASPADLEKYQTVLFELMVLHMQYSMSEGCKTEADTRAICGRMQAILNAWDCECDVTSNSAYSVEVVPVIGVGGGMAVIGGTTWYSETGVPSSSLGNLNDFYLDTDTGSIYKKTSGGWVLQFTMAITALYGNYLSVSHTNLHFVISDVFTEIISHEFAEDEVADGTVLCVDANLIFTEPTGGDTQLRLNLVGDSATDSTTITVDASLGGASFPVTLKTEYYVKDVAGTLTVVGKRYELVSNTGIVAYDFSAISIALAELANEINVLAKSDDNATPITLYTFRVERKRTV